MLTELTSFQERIFSPRNVVFINGQVFFQCQLRIWSEDTCYEAEPSNATADKPYGSLMAMALSPKYPPHDSFDDLIMYYSQRELSYDSDALNAAAGLLRMLTGRLGCEMIQGLPTFGLDAYLLFVTTHDKSIPKRRVQFASYSWAGWKGRVDWFEHAYVYFKSPLKEPPGWVRERAWISWTELRPNGIACSISNLPEIMSDSSLLKSAARTRLETEIPSIRRDVEQVVLKITDANLARRYQYPLLTFMTVSVIFKVGVEADLKDEETSIFELSDKESNICGYVWYDQSPPEILKDHSEFILLSETNYGHRKFPMLSTEVGPDGLQVQSGGEEARNVHNGDDDTGNQSPEQEIDAQKTDEWGYSLDWGFYWVLLIEWDNGVAERRGIGQIYKTAAEKSFPPGPAWKQIYLA